MKGTFGRIPRSPHAYMRPHTVVLGNLSRSVRDAARVLRRVRRRPPRGPDQPPVARRVGGRPRHPGPARSARRRRPRPRRRRPRAGVEDRIRDEAKALIADNRHGGGRPPRASRRTSPPSGRWATSPPCSPTSATSGRRCSDELTDEMAVGLHLAEAMYNLRTAAAAEELRVQANEVMARGLRAGRPHHRRHQPRPAFPAEWAPARSSDADHREALRRRAAPATACGGLLGSVRLARRRGAEAAVDAASAMAAAKCPTSSTWAPSRSSRTSTATPPCRSRPAPSTDCPSACRCSAAHHRDALLFDVALSVERERPWPMVAPGVAC